MFSKNKQSEESKLLIQEYAKNPINNFKMEDATITQHEGNFVCGDDITIYLKINENKLENISFDGNCSTITTASASFVIENALGKNIEEILDRNYETLKKLGFEVSNRRKRSAVIAIVAIQNAIYKYKNEEKTIELEDLIDD